VGREDDLVDDGLDEEARLVLREGVDLTCLLAEEERVVLDRLVDLELLEEVREDEDRLDFVSFLLWASASPRENKIPMSRPKNKRYNFRMALPPNLEGLRGP
jgi:hypothetical protein